MAGFLKAFSSFGFASGLLTVSCGLASPGFATAGAGAATGAGGWASSCFIF
jgi:hypothetical protein